MGGLAFMSLYGEICFCVSVARTAGNCFSIGAGMPSALLFRLPVIPSEVPIVYMRSLFLGKQGSHLACKPCWWIVWRTLEEYEIYSKGQLGSVLSLTLGFPKCWLHVMLMTEWARGLFSHCWPAAQSGACCHMLDHSALLVGTCRVPLTCSVLLCFFFS